MKKQDILVIGIGIICFGAAMAMRDNMPYIWIRAVVAGAAFVVLGAMILLLSGRKKN